MTETVDRQAETDEVRLAELDLSRLLDSPPEAEFDRITRLTRRVLDADAAFISLVDRDRQFLKSKSARLAEESAAGVSEPLAYSFCKYAVASGDRFVVTDAHHDPLVRTSPAVDENGVVAYAGHPLETVKGNVLGTLCVVYHHPHDWSDDELELLEELTALAVTEIEYRLRARELEAIRSMSDRLVDPLESLGDAVRTTARLAETPDDPRLPRLAETAVARVRTVEAISADLREAATARPGASIGSDLVDLVGRATRLAISSARADDLVVKLPEGPVTVRAERSLDRPVAALVHAAMQHLGDAPPAVVEVRPEDGSALLEIRSPGRGLPVSDLLRLVSKFHGSDDDSSKAGPDSASVTRTGRVTTCAHGPVTASTGPEGFEFRIHFTRTGLPTTA